MEVRIQQPNPKESTILVSPSGHLRRSSITPDSGLDSVAAMTSLEEEEEEEEEKPKICPPAAAHAERDLSSSISSLGAKCPLCLALLAAAPAAHLATHHRELFSSLLFADRFFTHVQEALLHLLENLAPTASEKELEKQAESHLAFPKTRFALHCTNCRKTLFRSGHR